MHSGLDIGIIVVIILGGWNGYRLGVIRQITRLFGTVISYFASIWLRPYVTPFIQHLHLFSNSKNQHISPLVGQLFGNLSGAISFGLVFVITYLILRYAVSLLDALFSLPVLSTINRFVGFIAGLAVAVIFVYVACAILRYINDPQIQLLLHHSRIATWLLSQSFNGHQAVPVAPANVKNFLGSL